MAIKRVLLSGRISGGLGDDTYFVDDPGAVIGEAVGGGYDTVITSVSYRLPAGSEIEVLRTYGSATTAPISLTGNQFRNVLVGNAGANRLDGGAGADILWGYGGDDTYYVDTALDVVNESTGQGYDTVITRVSYTLAEGAEVELLRTYGSATADPINLTGNSFGNTLIGNSAANLLDGRGGGDYMWGYGGDDTYVVDAVGDTVVERAGEGVDTVISTRTSTTLWRFVENLLLRPGAVEGYGNELNNVLTGNAAANYLMGEAGDDVLDGGLGADLLNGGPGDDILYVDDPGDVVFEYGWQGLDTIRSSVSYTLPVAVEVLVLTGTGDLDGAANTTESRLIGNSGANRLTGSAVADWLDGGAGADTLVGRGGPDTYVLDDLGDVVVEADEPGTDTIRVPFSYALGANVETLILLGTAHSNGTGNELDNVIIGNAGVNVLVGGLGDDLLDGRAGGDVMTGGLGDDTYIVDSAADVITEVFGQGMDTVRSTFSHVLASSFEHLILDGDADADGTGNAANNDLLGNAGVNRLVGYDGDDRLDGRGGADALVGGRGDDTYVLDDPGDTVLELQGEGVDTVRLSVADYTLPAHVERLEMAGFNHSTGRGNALANTLIGDAYENTLIGGGGSDTFIGAGAADRFVYLALSDSTVGAPDWIADFHPGQDTIDLSAIDADASTIGVNEAFRWVSAFTQNPGEAMLTYEIPWYSSILLLDVDGDGAADFMLQMAGDPGTGPGWIL